MESGLAWFFPDANLSRHSEIPLVSGVNIAGLALMGQMGEEAFSGQKTPTDLDARIWRDVTHDCALC